MDIQELKIIVTFMRENGVIELRDGDLELKLGPMIHSPVQMVDEKLKDLDTAFKARLKDQPTSGCACGHSMYRHRGGLCVEGCSPHVCLPEDELRKYEGG